MQQIAGRVSEKQKAIAGLLGELQSFRATDRGKGNFSSAVASDQQTWKIIEWVSVWWKSASGELLFSIPKIKGDWWIRET